MKRGYGASSSERAMQGLTGRLGKAMARYLARPVRRYEPFAVTDPQILRAVLRPCDVLLVEGNLRFSTAIKYLTQSTWSHAAIYVGDALGTSRDHKEPMELIEADLTHGVTAVPVSKYSRFNTRICRPVGLSDEDEERIVAFLIDHLGMAYDLKHIIDLARYLVPNPPVPVHWRRRMLALGSGEPTRAICSSLIAQAFQAVKYPILPYVTTKPDSANDKPTYLEREILHIRHHSLFTPRDFDVSPYFQVIKPSLEHGFDYKKLTWEEEQR